MSKPQLVFVPGSAHVPAHMAPLMEKMKSFGYTSHCRQMASVDNPNPPEDLSQDIAVLRSLVEEAIGDGNDVIVLPHSWAGIVAGSALVGMSKKEREAVGKKGGVIRTGYMAAFLLPEGVSLLALSQGKPADWITREGNQLIYTDPEAFYNDVPEKESKYWFSLVKTHAAGSIAAKATGAAWKVIPTSYLLCEEDLAIPPGRQEEMIRDAKSVGAEIDVTRIKSSHSPFLSKINETAQWVRRVAGEKV